MLEAPSDGEMFPSSRVGRPGHHPGAGGWRRTSDAFASAARSSTHLTDKKGEIIYGVAQGLEGIVSTGTATAVDARPLSAP